MLFPDTAILSLRSKAFDQRGVVTPLAHAPDGDIREDPGLVEDLVVDEPFGFAAILDIENEKAAVCDPGIVALKRPRKEDLVAPGVQVFAVFFEMLLAQGSRIFGILAIN
jgi:hypothetical protein